MALPQVCDFCCLYMLLWQFLRCLMHVTVLHSVPMLPSVLSLSSPLDPPAVMMRLDAASLFSLHPPSFQLDLHGLLMDNMTLQSPEPAFLCSPIASLPEGVGVAVLTTVGIKYDSTIKVGPAL